MLQVIYKAAAELTGFEASDMIAVGDSLFHDIQGAMKNSIDSVFVAGGIHASDLGIGHIGDQPNPDELQLLLKSEGFYPTYVVPMFSW
jgi:ribonucleotide monophosphatase NagD (HAD superfamily)